MKKNLFLYTFVAALGGLLFGFDTAVINGAIPFFTVHFALSDTMKGWAVSSALFGCIAGALSVGKPADIWGRLTMLRVMALLFLVSSIGTGLSNNLGTFIAFRVIGGLAIGGASVVSPMYISEISPAKYRGRFAIAFQVAIVLGILVAFFSDYVLLNTGPNNWRWMFIAGAVPSLAFLILLFFVGRSPRWLVRVGRIEEARNVILSVGSDTDPEKTVEEIRQSINTEVMGKSIYLFKKPYLRLVFIGIMVGMINQLTGINVVMYYATDIFRSAGFSTESAIGQTVFVGLTNLLFTFVGMQLIDRVGRRALLLAGSLGMSVFLGIFAYAYFQESAGGFVLLFCLVGFAAFFAATQGSVIWVLLAEMFPNNIRSRGSAIGSFSHWFFNSLTSLLFPVVSTAFSSGHGTAYIFAFYSIATFSSFFFFKKFLVETKGKSLEEIEKHVLK
jgi:sugar porter (SP) family MFS transporter